MLLLDHVKIFQLKKIPAAGIHTKKDDTPPGDM